MLTNCSALQSKEIQHFQWHEKTSKVSTDLTCMATIFPNMVSKTIGQVCVYNGHTCIIQFNINVFCSWLRPQMSTWLLKKLLYFLMEPNYWILMEMCSSKKTQLKILGKVTTLLKELTSTSKFCFQLLCSLKWRPLAVIEQVSWDLGRLMSNTVKFCFINDSYVLNFGYYRYHGTY